MLEMVPDDEMRIVVRHIGPVEAKELLESNTNNYRNTRPSYVAKLADDMTAGRWKENGETIKVAKDGTLLDGQHRILAIVKSGVRLRMVVVMGLENDSMKTIDIGSGRTAADALRFEGVASATRASAVARTILLHRTQAMSPSHPQVVDFVVANEEAIVTATNLGVRVHDDLKGGVAIYGAGAFELMEVSRLDAVDFMGMFAGDIGVSRGHPVHALRARFKNLISRSRSANPAMVTEHLLYIFKAWNLTVREESSLFLRVGSTEKDALKPLKPRHALSRDLALPLGDPE